MTKVSRTTPKSTKSTVLPSNAYIQKSKTNYWGTPMHLYNQYRGLFDPCPFPKPAWDGLTVNWLSHEKVFCNPPYDNIKAWAQKCYETLMEAKRTASSISYYLSTYYMYNLCLPVCDICNHYEKKQGASIR